MSDVAKETLHRYLRANREAMLFKLEGLSERQLRTPMTPTGTNLLGLVKHTASVEIDYFGSVFGRPSDEPQPWLDDDSEDNADMWATADESKEWQIDFCRRVWAHADATIEALDLDAQGIVPWWGPDRREVTLQQILVHMISEIARHAGHADIVRELLDGTAGLSRTNSNLPARDEAWWLAYVARLQSVADAATDVGSA